jgi:ribonuclease P protein component
VPSYAFTKNRRLLKASEYKEVFDRNRLKVAHPNLLLLALPNNSGQSRLGLVLGKKNIPTAVGRNRVKRVVRETFRQFDFPVALDIVFLARKGADQMSSQEMNLLLHQSWCRLQQRCESLGDHNA